MVEEKTPDKPEEKVEAPVEEKVKAGSMIDKANEAASRMEKANKHHEELIAKEEALKVERTLSGNAEAGMPPKEETPEDYAKKVMANDAETKD